MTEEEIEGLIKFADFLFSQINLSAKTILSTYDISAYSNKEMIEIVARDVIDTNPVFQKFEADHGTKIYDIVYTYIKEMLLCDIMKQKKSILKTLKKK